MDKKSSYLSKLADRLLKNSDRISEFESARNNAARIKNLHEAISNRYKFYTTRGYATDETKRDADYLKTIEKKLTLTVQEKDRLDRLFYKYSV